MTLTRLRRGAPHAAGLAVLLGAGLAVQGLLDPAVQGRALPGALLAALGGLLATRRRRLFRAAAGLALLCAAASACQPSFSRADSTSYYVYLRSAAFDHDLDFTNEYRRWGHDLSVVTPTGRPANQQSVGPAVLWSPVYALAHVYAAVAPVLGGGSHPRDGYSPPYFRATAVGTLLVALLGGLLLARSLAPRLGPAGSHLLVAVALAGSPVVYYLFFVPAMAHGCAWGVAAATVWARDRLEQQRDRRGLLTLAALCGLLTLVRWQGVLVGLAVLPTVAGGLRRGWLRPRWVLEGLALAALSFSPQLLAWRALYGSWLTMPQGGGFIDWSSPHLFDVLLSADHGLLTWTPLVAVAVAGTLLELRRDLPRAAGALAFLAAMAWVNGGVRDWAASDAFGARRFDVVLPFLVPGLAAAFELGTHIAARRPALVPTLAGLALVAWNAGLLRLYERRTFTAAAPLAELASAQARAGVGLARALSDRLAGLLGGARGRDLSYRVFVGEYLYENINPGGTVAVGGMNDSLLDEGWSRPVRRAGSPPFRWAYLPQACLRLPLREPVDLPATLTARVPRELSGVVDVAVGDTVVARLALGSDWQDLPFLIPARSLVPGENRVCLRFTEALPGPPGGRVAAAVSLL